MYTFYMIFIMISVITLMLTIVPATSLMTRPWVLSHVNLRNHRSVTSMSVSVSENKNSNCSGRINVSNLNFNLLKVLHLRIWYLSLARTRWYQLCRDFLIELKRLRMISKTWERELETWHKTSRREGYNCSDYCSIYTDLYSLRRQR